MAINGPLPVAFADVFPQGAYALNVEAQRDFDKSSRDNFVQATTDTGVRLWVVQVIDGDTSARQSQVKVKIAADVQPVLPEGVAGVPFHPVEFDGLCVRPYVDRQSGRLAYSFTATGIKAPAGAGTRATGNGSTSASPAAASASSGAPEGKDAPGRSGKDSA